jgi:GDP/UDP-N,N'-diacetylbacillosamine 2-epimerase (hydrolysing)
MSARRVCYVTGTRADFGLMRRTLQAVHAHPSLRLDLLVTGMHLSDAHGMTVREIEASALPVRARVGVELAPATGATMARNIGLMTQRFTELLEADRPDLVMLLGDRGEMLAGAIAALHLNLPILHVHGGERSGTVDEPVRHAVSKLAHYHCVATEGSRERLLRMGEHEDAVFVTGAPGLDGLREDAALKRGALCAALGLDATRQLALLVFHPVHAEAALGGPAAREILGALRARHCQVVALMPNADAGSAEIRAVLAAAAGEADVRVLTHLERPHFASWMAACDLMVGNSSSGIIEAATFGTPVLNLGSRQNLRERNLNVVDVALEAAAIGDAIGHALQHGRYPPVNRYGDGRAADRIVQHALSVPIGSQLRAKCNAY